MEHLDALWVGFVLGVMRVDLTFPLFSKPVIMLTLDFDPNRILLRVGSVPPAYCRVFTIFFWKLGIMVVSDNTFQS